MGTGKRILCIDDSNTTLMLMDYALTNTGYQVLLALNVEEAIRYIEIDHPDLILLDLSMPGVSGYDFLKMRTELRIENIPVIIISAYDSAESVTNTKELGAVEFISKPIKIELVLKVIASYLN